MLVLQSRIAVAVIVGGDSPECLAGTPALVTSGLQPGSHSRHSFLEFGFVDDAAQDQRMCERD